MHASRPNEVELKVDFRKVQFVNDVGKESSGELKNTSLARPLSRFFFELSFSSMFEERNLPVWCFVHHHNAKLPLPMTETAIRAKPLE